MVADPLRDLVFAGPAHDRAAHLRPDPGIVSTLLADPTTRVLDVARMAVGTTGDAGAVSLRRRPPQPSDDRTEMALLSRTDDGHVLAALASDEGDLTPLRQVADRLSPVDAGLAATAVALDNWHHSHPRCACCGEPTVITQAGWRRQCPVDGTEHHPRTDPAVIMTVVDADDRLLLARGTGWPEGRMSLLAGFVEPGETLADAVAREVFEEVGVRVSDARFVADQPWPFPASLMLGFEARAVTTQLTLDTTEIVEAEWFTRETLAEAYDTGRLRRPTAVSISARLIERWYGGPLAVGAL